MRRISFKEIIFLFQFFFSIFGSLYLFYLWQRHQNQLVQFEVLAKQLEVLLDTNIKFTNSNELSENPSFWSSNKIFWTLVILGMGSVVCFYLMGGDANSAITILPESVGNLNPPKK